MSLALFLVIQTYHDASPSVTPIYATTPKRDANYHRRSLSETAMFRQKATFGGKVRSRNFENQATELLCQCAMLNRMIHLGKPVSVPVAA
jgi:hypothetical protein